LHLRQHRPWCSTGARRRRSVAPIAPCPKPGACHPCRCRGSGFQTAPDEPCALLRVQALLITLSGDVPACPGRRARAIPLVRQESSRYTGGVPPHVLRLIEEDGSEGRLHALAHGKFMRAPVIATVQAARPTLCVEVEVTAEDLPALRVMCRPTDPPRPLADHA